MKIKGAFTVFFRIGLVTLTTMVKTAHCHDPENAQIVIQAKKIERDAVNGIMYGNFRKHEFRRLSPRGRKETVAGITKPIDCTKSCLIAFWCWSYNLKRKANPDGTFLCELLSTHMYEKESKEEFRPDRDFDHHSIETACDETPCQNGGTCAPLYFEDDYNCTCTQGFTGKRCDQDKDECSLGSHDCHVNATCKNKYGSYNCTCKDGFEGDGKVACTDEDECTRRGKCHARATCTNTHGSFNCTCNDGFEGDGETKCEDVNECTSSKHNCSGDTVCNNTVGSFVCVCKSGFKSDASGGCKEIDQCSLCDSNALCDVNKKCKCNADFIGDGHKCYSGENGDCKHLKNAHGFTSNGWYRIRAKKEKSYMAHCQMETEGGQHPWTVFQRRVNGDTSFSKERQDYVEGFNDGSNIWLGLKALVEFSRKGSLNLLVEMEDWEGNKANASYKKFKVIRKSNGNKRPYVDPSLKFSSGTAGDSLSYHKNQQFSYVGEDNDGENNKHCAQEFQAGWWFKECPPTSTPPYWSNLNGQYLGNTDNIHGIIWTSFKGKLSLKSTEMKFQFSD